jgi:hypothetical protein
MHTRCTDSAQAVLSEIKARRIRARYRAMLINVEVTGQLLDAVSFVLVSPEFLGQQKLDAARRVMHSISDFITAVRSISE